jgi:hypothetical protein
MPKLMNVYAAMPHNALVRELQKRGKRPIEISQIVEEVQQYRKSKRADHMRRQQHDVLWGDVLAPLDSELKSVKSMARYISRAYNVPERDAAIEQYQITLIKARNLLKKYWKAYELTPRRLAKEKGIPNNGEHWTDWVPDNVKAKITALFDAIPRNFKAKVKKPFERTINVASALQKRNALRKRTDKALDAAIREHRANPTEETDEQIELINRAIKILDSGKFPEDAPVPLTWHGVLKHWG